MKKTQNILFVITAVAPFLTPLIFSLSGKNCGIGLWTFTYIGNYFIAAVLLNVVFIIYASFKIKKVDNLKKVELKKVIIKGVFSVVINLLIFSFYFMFTTLPCNVNS